MGKKRILLIYIDEWGSWIFLTFGLSLLLIFLSLYIFSHSMVFSNFTSYCFTLLAVTFYLFDHHVENTVEVNVPKIRKILNISVLVFIAIIYVMINTHGAAKTFVESNFTAISSATAAVVFLLTAWLMGPLIRRQVEETKGRKEKAMQEKEREKFERMKSQV